MMTGQIQTHALGAEQPPPRVLAPFRQQGSVQPGPSLSTAIKSNMYCPAIGVLRWFPTLCRLFQALQALRSAQPSLRSSSVLLSLLPL
jgi:hypothetical protein